MSLAAVKPAWIEEAVAQIAGRKPASLAWFVERFLESRFLFDYLEAPKLLFRLNQVVRRIKLRPLPDSTTTRHRRRLGAWWNGIFPTCCRRNCIPLIPRT